MSRVKHGIFLVCKILFLLGCFLLASSYTALAAFVAGGPLDATKGKMDLSGCEILVFDGAGQSLSYEEKDGKIVFDIEQKLAGEEPLCVAITFPAYTYDVAPMRDFLKDILGENAAREEAYLRAMEEGPWRSHLNLTLSGDVEGKFPQNCIYTVEDPDGGAHTFSVSREDRLEDVFVSKGEKLTFLLSFGVDGRGNLSSGRYELSAEISMAGLWAGDAPSLSFFSTVEILGKTVARGAAERGPAIFQVENWLIFYGAMIAFGCFVYLWRDVRNMIKIFGALMEGEGVPVIISTYVNGVCVESYESTSGGPSVFLALLVTVLCYMVFLLTIPIRILIHIVRDIIYLIREDYELDGFSLLGNILGSVGIYVAVFGVAGLFGGSPVVGGIAAVVGIAMCVVAGILCKRKEEEA